MGKVLSAEQLERYQRDGILFPVPVLSPAETARFRAAFEELAARLGGRPVAQALGHTQLYFRWAYDLATHPAILDAVEDVLGPDILVWTVSIFPKYPRDAGYISWHQDGTYWGLDSTQVTTAWVALTDSVVENGCMRVVPGSHQSPILPHRDTYAARQPAEPWPGDRGARRGEGRGGRRPAGRRDVAPPRQHHPRLEPQPLGPLPDRLRPALHHAEDPADRRAAPDRGARARAGRLRPLRLLPGPPALGFDEAVAAQQAGAERFLAQIRKTRGHYAG